MDDATTSGFFVSVFIRSLLKAKNAHLCSNLTRVLLKNPFASITNQSVKTKQTFAKAIGYKLSKNSTKINLMPSGSSLELEPWLQANIRVQLLLSSCVTPDTTRDSRKFRRLASSRSHRSAIGFAYIQHFRVSPSFIVCIRLAVRN